MCVELAVCSACPSLPWLAHRCGTEGNAFPPWNCGLRVARGAAPLRGCGWHEVFSALMSSSCPSLPVAQFVTRFGGRISLDHAGGDFQGLWLVEEFYMTDSRWVQSPGTRAVPSAPPALCLARVPASRAKHCERASLSSKPSSLYSPTTILKYQRGNCFDFSVLLCSLLVGAGYDAYCVQGYATRQLCTLDETLELCPLLRRPQEVRPAARGRGGAQHACSACSLAVSSRAEPGGTASRPHCVSACTKQGPHRRDL